MKKFADTMPKPQSIAQELQTAETKAKRLSDEIGKMKSDLPGIEAKVSDLSTALESSRRERQRLSALGESLAVIDKQVEKLQRELDAASDKAAGINALLIEKGDELETVACYVQEKSKDLATAELFAIYDEYNDQAALLGRTVERIYRKRIAMGMERPYSVDVCVDEKGALQLIPKLLQGGIYREGRAPNSTAHKDNDELYWWSLENFQYATEKSLGPITKEAQAAAQ